jgi:hypothetical protein
MLVIDEFGERAAEYAERRALVLRRQGPRYVVGRRANRSPKIAIETAGWRVAG